MNSFQNEFKSRGPKNETARRDSPLAVPRRNDGAYCTAKIKSSRSL